MVWRSLRTALLALLLLLAAPALAQRVALVIGNGAFRNVERLANPASDARAMAASLRRVGFTTDLVVAADQGVMEAAIRRVGAIVHAARKPRGMLGRDWEATRLILPRSPQTAPAGPRARR